MLVNSSTVEIEARRLKEIKPKGDQCRMSDDPAGDCGQRTKMTKSPSVLNPVGNGMARRVATARFHSGMLATIGIFATSDLEISILTDVMGLLSSAHSGGEMFEARVMRESLVRISPPVQAFTLTTRHVEDAPGSSTALGGPAASSSLGDPTAGCDNVPPRPDRGSPAPERSSRNGRRIGWIT